MSILDDILSQLGPSHIPQPGNATQAGYSGPLAPPQPAAAPATPPSLMSSLGGPPEPPANGLMARIAQRLMPTDPSYAGMISPAEAQRNRGNAIMQAGLAMMRASSPADPQHPAATTLGAIGLGGQTGLAAFDQNQQQSLAARQQGIQASTAQRQMAGRAAIAQQFAPPPNETPVQEAQRLDNMSQAYSNLGLAPEAENSAKAAAALHTRIGYGALAGAGAIKDTSSGMVRVDPTTGKVTPLLGPDGKQLQSNAVTEGDRGLDRSFKQLQFDQAKTAHEDSLDTRAGQMFQTRNGDSLKMLGNLGQVSSLLDQAGQGNTYATQALPGALAGVLDPKSRVGPSILAKVSTYDPSIIGRIQQYTQQNFQGTIPPADLKMIRQAIQATYDERSAGPMKDYDQLLKSRPGVANMLGTKESLFSNGGSLMGGGQPAPGQQQPAAAPAVNPYR